MDVEQPAAGENLVELIFLQLVHAGAARDNHRLDIKVVQRIGHAVEKHAIVGRDFLALVVVA